MAIDWSSHYKNKVRSLDFATADLDIFYVQNKELIDFVLARKPGRALEAGAGLGRDSFVLAQKGLSVTLLDNERKLLELGAQNAARLGLEALVDVQEGDLFHLADTIPTGRYDIAFSSGVFEHFEDADIRAILEQELSVVPCVVFTVPIHSERNLSYFTDSVFRRLLSPDEWLKILAPFNVTETKLISGRHDDLLVVVDRRPS